jgi:hypothetical protein
MMPSPSVLPNLFSLSFSYCCSEQHQTCNKTKGKKGKTHNIKHTLEVIKNLFDLLGVDRCAQLCVGLGRSGCSVVVVVDCDLNIPLGILEQCDGRLLPNGSINKEKAQEAKGSNPVQDVVTRLVSSLYFWFCHRFAWCE